MSRFFAIFATDKPGHLAVREQIRPQHRYYLRNPYPHPVVVHLGGPTLTSDTGLMGGTLLVVEAETLGEVKAFLNDDPYVRAGIFEKVEIRQWQWGIGNPSLVS